MQAVMSRELARQLRGAIHDSGRTRAAIAMAAELSLSALKDRLARRVPISAGEIRRILEATGARPFPFLDRFFRDYGRACGIVAEPTDLRSLSREIRLDPATALPRICGAYLATPPMSPDSAQIVARLGHWRSYLGDPMLAMWYWSAALQSGKLPADWVQNVRGSYGSELMKLGRFLEARLQFELMLDSSLPLEDLHEGFALVFRGLTLSGDPSTMLGMTAAEARGILHDLARAESLLAGTEKDSYRILRVAAEGFYRVVLGVITGSEDLVHDGLHGLDQAVETAEEGTSPKGEEESLFVRAETKRLRLVAVAQFISNETDDEDRAEVVASAEAEVALLRSRGQTHVRQRLDDALMWVAENHVYVRWVLLLVLSFGSILPVIGSPCAAAAAWIPLDPD